MNWMLPIETPIGLMHAYADERGLTALDLPTHVERTRVEVRATDVLVRVRDQLDAYFAGTRTTFDLPLAPAGTEFQQRVWQTLLRIPYGVTWSYGELATAIGNPSASRAVGAANGRNPLAIIVPCHRVIGASGALTGYGGGVPTKQWLLDHERRIAGHQLALGI